ncbi:choice-of-anchor Q domain-containing protein [Flavisolibacter nicotianae]|uniref:choice-of-anchor Q domain-containing protein n=1 Tax=Flavisolibacter nicotianae TaxID=2364882 RepID=UPI001F095DC3|nr:choice-of-anchor Q domain-containing protein [Flavisolibacter nicotianae]
MNRMKNLLPVAVLLCFLFSCRKESFTTDSRARLASSVDTLHFDTVFTTTGSVSQFVKIINNNDKGIRLSSVRLAGGAASPFQINVDGVAGPQVSNVEVLGNDSAYIYVTVRINPTARDLPFVVRDSIELTYNGNRTWIQLDAFGQNAHFLRNRKITGNETWNNDLPYVILGGLTVDTNALLSINKGCRIYLHADAPFVIHGSLQVTGEKWDSTRVVFTGDRLDEPYRDFPASYPGLVFTASSQNNSIRYGIIKNAYQGIVVSDASSSGTKLQLSETIIDNAYDVGLLGINTSITARNLLVSNCGKNVILALGGRYDFVHSTIATFSNNFIQHKDPVLLLTNFLTQGNVVTVNHLNASFRNCIFWGDQNGFVSNEVVTAKQGNTNFNVTFDRVLWRVQTPPANATVSGVVSGEPLFDSINTAERFFNFRLKDGSPAINAGSTAGVPLDLDGNPRPVGLPDLGAYEKQ